MNKVNDFPALTAHFFTYFFPRLFITFEVAFKAKLLSSPGKLCLGKGIAMSDNIVYPYYLTYHKEIYQIRLFYIFELRLF